jgi:hypothetical protein
MPSSFMKRRSFLSSLLLAFVLVRCKKEVLAPDTSTGSNPPKGVSTTPPVVTPPPDVVTDDYLAQYTVTEIGTQIDTFPTIANTLSGYTDKISYNPGDTMSLYLSGPPQANEKIKFYDANANVVLSLNTDVVQQTAGNEKPWVDGFAYNKTTSIKLPDNLKSGVYAVMGKIPFVYKSNSAFADITVIHPSNTLNAYNSFGGKGLYSPDLNNRSTVVSSLRYMYFGDDLSASFYQWMDKQSYDVKYIADEDVEDYSQIENSRIVIIAGHSEYWTRQARVNIDKFIASGKNVLVLSGNTMFWQVRYDKSKQLMICYKGDLSDPLRNTIYSTTNWHLPVLKYPVTDTLGTDFMGGGFGTTLPNRWNGYKIVKEDSPLLHGTGLKNGDILKLPTFEYDGAPVVKMILPGSSEIPVIDTKKLNCHKTELLGYDFAINGKQPGLGTFVLYQRTAESGVVVNTASMNWCSQVGMGGADKTRLEIITKNMIDLSLNNSNLFSN